jgi:hypothetical protein
VYVFGLAFGFVALVLFDIEGDEREKREETSISRFPPKHEGRSAARAPAGAQAASL